MIIIDDGGDADDDGLGCNESIFVCIYIESSFT